MFDEEYESMLQNAIAAIGNYGVLEADLPSWIAFLFAMQCRLYYKSGCDRSGCSVSEFLSFTKYSIAKIAGIAMALHHAD